MGDPPAGSYRTLCWSSRLALPLCKFDLLYQVAEDGQDSIFGWNGPGGAGVHHDSGTWSLDLLHCFAGEGMPYESYFVAGIQLLTAQVLVYEGEAALAGSA